MRKDTTTLTQPPVVFKSVPPFCVDMIRRALCVLLESLRNDTFQTFGFIWIQFRVLKPHLLVVCLLIVITTLVLVRLRINIVLSKYYKCILYNKFSLILYRSNITLYQMYLM